MSEDTRNDSTALLTRIVSQDPSSPLYLPVAERMREQGRVEEAIRLCEERRGRPGQGVGDHVVLGRCYLAAGRLTEARAQFEAAVALDRENVVALKALAGILSHDGQHGAASDFYRAVCRIDPGDLESQTALHQITSGEFPEVRPPDLVVAQGESTWQPVQPPREEEYLGRSRSACTPSKRSMPPRLQRNTKPRCRTSRRCRSTRSTWRAWLLPRRRPPNQCPPRPRPPSLPRLRRLRRRSPLPPRSGITGWSYRKRRSRFSCPSLPVPRARACSRTNRPSRSGSRSSRADAADGEDGMGPQRAESRSSRNAGTPSLRQGDPRLDRPEAQKTRSHAGT